MIAPDVNLLLYAHNPQSPFYQAATRYWQNALSGTEQIGIPVLCVHAFIRISTSSAFGADAFKMPEAARIVESWLSHSHVQILQPGERHWTILLQLLASNGARSRLVTDAAIAAIAIEHGAVIHSADGDFALFPDLRWTNPLLL